MSESSPHGMLSSAAAALAQRNDLDKLAPAFVKAWGKVSNVVKNANNPHFGNDYADLAAVLDVVKPAFASEGIGIVQLPGPMDGDKISVVMMVIHESGQRFTSTMQIPVGGKMTAQAAGSAITYARRYGLQAVAGIAPVDDDGSAASEPPPKPEKAKKAKSKPEPEPEEDERGHQTYAETKERLLAAIDEAGSVAELDAIKEEVRELNDDEVSTEYVTHRKALKGGKK